MIVLKNIGAAIAVCFLLFLTPNGNGQEKQKQPITRSASSRRTAPVDAELARLRAEVIEKMKESRASAEKLLAIHDEEKTKLTIEYQRRREFYGQGLISRSELNQVERALAEAIVRVEEDKRWLTESDIAITEATMRDELLRLPDLATGGYSETGTLVRFNGGTPVVSSGCAKDREVFLANLWAWVAGHRLRSNGNPRPPQIRSSKCYGRGASPRQQRGTVAAFVPTTVGDSFHRFQECSAGSRHRGPYSYRYSHP